MNADERNPEHEAVDGGFVCDVTDDCDVTCSTPLGIARHRARHRRKLNSGERA